VLRAAAVSKIGLPYLDSLNSVGHYAMGGLVGPTLPAFAGGGSVGGGNTLVLNLGNRSFHANMRGDVMSDLAQEARAKLITSTGPQPSFMGSR
jgi:hypothetical protein